MSVLSGRGSRQTGRPRDFGANGFELGDIISEQRHDLALLEDA